MAHECFEVTIENAIAHIVLNRPDALNTMNLAFWDELPAIVEDIDRNSRARVIVISSTGKHFTAGLDLGVFGADEATDGDAGMQRPAAFYSLVKGMQYAFSALEKARIPVLVAIQGGAIGGGVDMVTACDMRYCTADAFFTIYEINIGMTADVGTFPRILNHLPEGLVRELAYTGRRMSAEEALQYGLVNRVYPDQAAMLEGVMEIAADIASKAPLAVYGCKQVINYARDHSTEDTLDYIAVWNMSMLQKGQVFEAFTAKSEKRAANFAELPPISDKTTSV